MSKFIPRHPGKRAGHPGTQGAYTPDVSLSASRRRILSICLAAAGWDCVSDSSGHFLFMYRTGLRRRPRSMAGVAALLNHKMGGPQGI